MPPSPGRLIRWILCCGVICLAQLPPPDGGPLTPNSEQFITTVAGGGSDRVLAEQASLGGWTPSVAIDGQGNIYVPVPALGAPAVCTTLGVPGAVLSHVLRIDPAGRLTKVAGNGRTEYEGDGGAALAAQFNGLYGIASDAAGNLFLSGVNRIRRVDANSGLVTTIAGNGVTGYSGDGGPATSASISVGDLALDPDGNLYAVGSNRVRRIDASTGIISTVAGNGISAYSGDGEPATQASLNEPRSVAVDAEGSVFIGEQGGVVGEGPRIRFVNSSTGIISTVAGNGVWGVSGDGGPATEASLRFPEGLALDRQNHLYIAHSDGRIRRVDLTTGFITSLLLPCLGPEGVAVDELDNLIVAGCSRIYHVDASTGLVTRVDGTGSGSFAGDGGPATGAVFSGPSAVAVDPLGGLFIADSWGMRIRRVEAATGIIQTVAGGGTGGDGSPAIAARVRYASGLAVDAAGNLFISETNGDLCTPSHRVRMVEAATGIITTIAGNGTGGFGGDGGPATSAPLNYPIGLALDPTGNLFIADASNSRVRRVDAATGIITTVAGNGIAAYAGDGGPATSASLVNPNGIAFDPAGNLFIADATNSRVRRVDAATGIITTVAGTGVGGFGGDDGPAEMARLDRPLSVAVDASGVLFIADSRNHRIRRVDPLTGIITTLAGDGVPDFLGDTGSAAFARFERPYAVALGPDGSLFVADNQNNRVRRISTLPPAAGSVPCEGWTPERPLTLDVRLGELGLSWGSSCLSTDQDYAVYEGSLGDWYSHTPRLCSTGGSRSITLTPPSGSAYYLVVPRNLTREGSYGRRSDGLERPPSASACLPQEIAGLP